MYLVQSLNKMHFCALNVIETTFNYSNWTMQKYKELNLKPGDTLGEK